MKLVLNLFVSLACITLLTILTQVGGIIYVLSLFFHRFIEKRVSGHWKQVLVKTLFFFVLYTVCTFTLVPLVAKQYGRVPMPVLEKNHVQPANILTCLLNRHYVRPALRTLTYSVGGDMNKHYPGTVVNYLDANFPFIDKFPLLPHLSHNDGKKLDVAFQYNASATGEITNEVPSFIGYGICETPAAGEVNAPATCAEKGYWQYSVLQDIVPQRNKKSFTFSAERTKALVTSFAAQQELGKIFLEPHLKTRLQLTSNKIRFHGCQAVRHDDHIHVQLR